MEEGLSELWEVAEHQDFWERFHSAVKQGRVRNEERKAFTSDASSRCYNHLMSTALIWAEAHWLGTDAPFATERRR